MGTALTYARRYALFTLVGIAGEDDLDAPDLPVKTADIGTTGTNYPEKMNGGAKVLASPSVRAAGNESRLKPSFSRPVLDVEASALVRDRFVNEIAGLQSEESAIVWAQLGIGAKNTLSAEDASIVETAFRQRMRVLEPEAYLPNTNPAELPVSPRETAPDPELKRLPAAAGDAPALGNESQQQGKLQGSRVATDGTRGHTFLKPLRHRDKDHIRFIAGQPRTVCGRKPSEAHHIRFAQPRALGRKVSDEFTVPLCRVHHRELHRQGNEHLWWNLVKIDPMPIALRFWQRTRGLTAVTNNHKPQDPKTEVSLEDQSGDIVGPVR